MNLKYSRKQVRPMDQLQNIFSPLEKHYNKKVEIIARDIGMEIYQNVNKLSLVVFMNHIFESENIDLGYLNNQYNLSTKLVRINGNGVPKESMSLEAIKFDQLVDEKWEQSFLRNKFLKTTFALVVFKEVDMGLTLLGIKLWKMPSSLIESELKDFWSNLNDTVINGVSLREEMRGSKKITLNNLPTSSQSLIMHVRPKAKNAADKVELPDGQYITKQGYWLNSRFIGKVINGEFDETSTESLNKSDRVTRPTTRPTLDLHNQSSENRQVTNINQKFTADSTGLEEAYYTSVVEGFKTQKIVLKEYYTYSELKKIMEQTTNQKLLKYELIAVAEKLNYGFHNYNQSFIKSSYLSFEEFIEQKVFGGNYFEVPEDSFWKSSVIKKLLYRYQKEFSLIQLNKNLFLTKKVYRDDGINKEIIASFVNDVLEASKEKEYFTFNSMRNTITSHPIYDFGFEDEFFDSILIYSGEFHFNEIEGIYFYSLRIRSITFPKILELVISGSGVNHLSIDEVSDQIQTNFNVKIDSSNITRTIKTRFTEIHYSNELDRAFLNKEAYLDFIYS